MLILIALLGGFIRLNQYIIRARAQRLQADIRSIELRKSTYADTRRLMDRWWDDAHEKGPCRRERCDVEIVLSDFTWTHGQFIWRTPIRSRIFRWLGERPAVVIANVDIRNDVVVAKKIEEYVGGPCNEFDGQTYCLTVMGHVETGEQRFIDPRHPEYSFYRPNGCTLCVDAQVILSPYADPVDVARLTDINFDCITRWYPCENESDILPIAWAQRQQEQTPPRTVTSCAETIRAYGRQLRQWPSARVTLVSNTDARPQVSVRWEESESQERDRRPTIFRVPESLEVHIGEHLLVFLVPPFNSCDVVPATDENVRLVREGISENLSNPMQGLQLPFGKIEPPSLDVQ